MFSTRAQTFHAVCCRAWCFCNLGQPGLIAYGIQQRVILVCRNARTATVRRGTPGKVSSTLGTSTNHTSPSTGSMDANSFLRVSQLPRWLGPREWLYLLSRDLGQPIIVGSAAACCLERCMYSHGFGCRLAPDAVQPRDGVHGTYTVECLGIFRLFFLIFQPPIYIDASRAALGSHSPRDDAGARRKSVLKMKRPPTSEAVFLAARNPRSQDHFSYVHNCLSLRNVTPHSFRSVRGGTLSRYQPSFPRFG